MFKYIKGQITSTMIVLLAVLGFGVGGAVIAVMSYVSAANYSNEMEVRIKAEWENNENILSGYSQKIREAAQIPTMQRDDLVKIFSGTLGARYGADGSKASMQWIKEQNPNLDQRTYFKLQQIIEAGRDEFKNAQTKLIDVKRSYETALGYVWKGFWMHLAGYPKLDLSKYRAISNDYAGEAFKTGKESGPIQLR